MGESIYYVNGRFVPASQAVLPVNDLAIVRGYGVFDFLRTYNGRPFHLADHLERLRTSAGQIGIALPHSLEEIGAIVHDALARNDLPEASIRLIVTGGPSTNFFTPQEPAVLLVMIDPVTTHPDSFYTAGTRVITTRLAREFPTVKSLNYIGAIMAMKEAAAAGAVEALYVDDAGRLSEGTRANFFLVKNGRLITAGEELLFGITRKVLLQLAAEITPIEERPPLYEELPQADEAFLTSSTKEIMPVVQVDDQVIGRGQVGPITRQLLELFRAYAYGRS